MGGGGFGTGEHRVRMYCMRHSAQAEFLTNRINKCNLKNRIAKTPMWRIILYASRDFTMRKNPSRCDRVRD